MLQDIEIHEYREHGFAHTARRCAGYALRGCVAAVGIGIALGASIVALPFAVYECLSPAGRRRMRSRRAYWDGTEGRKRQ